MFVCFCRIARRFGRRWRAWQKCWQRGDRCCARSTSWAAPPRLTTAQLCVRRSFALCSEMKVLWRSYPLTFAFISSFSVLRFFLIWLVFVVVCSSVVLTCLCALQVSLFCMRVILRHDSHIPLFTYKLAPGHSTDSLAFTVARMAGVNEELIDDAMQIKKMRD
jgi:hypothetical protein